MLDRFSNVVSIFKILIVFSAVYCQHVRCCMQFLDSASKFARSAQFWTCTELQALYLFISENFVNQ
jgi:hypothetical protein